MVINKNKLLNIHNYYVLTSCFYILLYIFITPPFYVADEYAHFQKATSKENIVFRGVLTVDKGIKNFADDYEILAYKKWNVDRSSKYNKNFITSDINKYNLTNEYTQANLASLATYPVTGYLIPKITSFFTQIFTDKVLIIFYAGRVGNFIFCMIACWLTLKTISSGKEYLFLLLSMPMTLTLFGSFNQDAALFSYTLFILFFSSKLNSHNKFTELNLFFIQLFCFLLIIGRPTYLPFGLLPLFFIKKFSYHKLTQFIFFFIFSILVFYILSSAETPLPSNPLFPSFNLFKLLSIIFNDLIVHLPKYIGLMIGGLGRIDLIVNLNIIVIFLLFIVYFFLKNINYKFIFTHFNLLLFLIFTSSFILTQLIQYIYFSPSGETSFIKGVQGRYFIPIFILLAMFQNKNSILNNKPINRTIIYIIPHLNIFVIYQYYSFFY